MDCSTPGHLSLTISWSLPKFTSIALVMSSSNLIFWCPLLLLLSIFPCIKDFSNDSTIHNRGPKYCSFSFSMSASNEYSELISLKIDWFDLLALQETLKSLLQHHSSKTLILRCSAFLWSNSLIHAWLLEKIIALTRWTFVGKVMFLLFNMLSRLVIAFLPRNVF